MGEYFNLNVYYTRMYLIEAAKYFNNICVECRDLKHICEMLQIKSFERVLLCISISAFTIHFYCHQRKHSARCTAFLCLPFSILSCAMKQLVRPSHMNWNMKLVMLDFWLICWYFFFSSLCIFCCRRLRCRFAVTFFDKWLDRWFAALTNHSFIHFHSYAGSQYQTWQPTHRNGNETYHSFGTDVMYNRNARMRNIYSV